MKVLLENLPLLLPLIIIELVLMTVALVHIFRHPNYRFGNRAVWILAVVFIQIIGPVIYLLFGRGEDE
ncbi:PLD nuclease N-terminal domain-containing protein [Lacrimispora sp. NSJ-141]|uniref:PLD nuclease N-terminal domain-containing protein n=1 Tax=Lientehia hominis TaxID=2897778 RepID=A0AAP2W882_9FIRM|nr:PLD nuclease N-terminal domain-containing protein [Lientehia hominis]MCD2491875.1 PLD nuclease N-terminal domain-containing protein [Lientehia hominis]